LLKTYDATRAGLSTAHHRRALDGARCAAPAPDRRTSDRSVPEIALAVNAEPQENCAAAGAVSPRRIDSDDALDRDMEVADNATALGIDPQTVARPHNKAS